MNAIIPDLYLLLVNEARELQGFVVATIGFRTASLFAFCGLRATEEVLLHWAILPHLQ
jgi:hypothetical protein